MRRHIKMKTAIQCLLVTGYAGFLGACTDAYAADVSVDQSQDVARRVVKYSDLDLTHAAGAVTLYSRIQSAARQVCAPSYVGWEWESLKSSRPCVDKAITRAVADVNAPTLTSYFMSKTRPTIRLAQKQ